MLSNLLDRKNVQFDTEGLVTSSGDTPHSDAGTQKEGDDSPGGLLSKLLNSGANCDDCKLYVAN
jgi:hypothetical protein